MKKRGFTLIELSIVLVIIGLLVGGVLKGKSMIENAKQKRVKTDIDGTMAAVYSYQDKFGYLPGDDPKDRSTELGATGCAAGGGNGLFDTTAEAACAWQEMVGAGFISGNPAVSSGSVKKSPYGGNYDLNASAGKNFISTANIPADAAGALDTKYDDGVYNSGDIQADTDYNTTASKKISWYAF